jgi:hypothetical protein
MDNKVSKISYPAVIITGFVAFGLSLLYYSPFLFGHIWMTFRDAPVNPLPGWTFAFAPLREIITAFLLAHLIVRLRITSWKSAVALGLGLWFVFYFVQLTGAVLWDNKPWQLGMVHGGDWLMKMLVMSVLLSLWHRKKLLSDN